MKLTIKEILDCNEWKTCSKCGDEKKLVFFSRRGTGYRPECKACDSKGYYARKANKANEAQPKPSLLKRLVAWITA